MKKIIFIGLLCCLALGGCEKADVTVTNLRTEMLSNPEGIDTATPRLSWELTCDAKDVRQTGYRVIVASTKEKLGSGEGDVWDSGEVQSDQSVYIAYGGPQLTSRQQLYWKVKVQTNRGESQWSDGATWSMGLLQPGDWKAQWVGHSALPDDNLTGKTQVPARYLRREFRTADSSAVSRATLYISGLGLYEAFIDGQRVGDSQLAPTPTDYAKDVKYNTYDVTSLLNGHGGHAIGVALGGGRFTAMRPDANPPTKHFGLPQLLLQLEISYADGTTETVATDETWKITTNGPIRRNNEFDGELYDARKEMAGWNKAGYNDADWLPVEMMAAPSGRLAAQMNPNIKCMETLKPVSISELKPGVYIADMGQNMVGWLQLRASGLKSGDQVTMRFAETLQADGSLYTANLRTAEATDTYIASGQADSITWHPVFTYHGFRYAEISGLRNRPTIDDLEGQVLYDEMATTGSFESSDEMLNRIYHNAYWGIRGNYRGMPTDCPQRDERMGWFGDRTTGALGEAYIFDNQLLYAKWLDDIEEAQTAEGSLPDVAPTYWQLYSDNMTWCGAYITVANMLYRQYGDTAPVKKHYASMKKWITYMKSHYMLDGILAKDTYGDWCMPPESPELIHSQAPDRITDGGLISTAFYYYLCGLMAEFARITDNEADISYFETERAMARNAFNETYFNKTEGCYGNNTVTANILPLCFGMVGEGNEQEVFDNIVRKTVTDFGGHVSTGVIGIQQLMRGLTDYGRGDLALQIATNTTYPSWGYMVENGATTIWELWNGNTADPAMNSGNHVMLLGDLILWDYSYLAGIANHPESTGFKRMLMKPRPVKGLSYVRASYRTIYGQAESSWTKQDGTFTWQLTIPCNSSAEVWVPTGGKEIDEHTRMEIVNLGTKYERAEQGYAIFSFPSGRYELSVPYQD